MSNYPTEAELIELETRMLVRALPWQPTGIMPKLIAAARESESLRARITELEAEIGGYKLVLKSAQYGYDIAQTHIAELEAAFRDIAHLPSQRGVDGIDAANIAVETARNVMSPKQTTREVKP